MEATYQMINDIIDNHSARMRNIKKYFPFFRLQETAFHLYKDGKYGFLDIGYITMAVLRYFIEENSFNNRAVTASGLQTFIRKLLERDFDLYLPESDAFELTEYIADKIKNDGRPFEMEYFDPADRKKKVARMKLVESRVEDGKVGYYITSEAIEFYLDTKEVRDESEINIKQMLLEKMIKLQNFSAGIDIIRRINSEVNKLKARKQEVLFILSNNVFDGVKALEEFNQTGMRWFGEEQKLFEHNMELIGKALAQSEGGQGHMEIFNLEKELKKAMSNHSELLSECMELQVKADEIIHRHKFSRLKNVFDFSSFVEKCEKNNDVRPMEMMLAPLFLPNIRKSFALSSMEDMLHEEPEAGEIAETVGESVEQMYKYDDETEEERIYGNYESITLTLLDTARRRSVFTLEDFNRILEEKYFDGIFKNNDYYSFLVHISMKKVIDISEIKKKQDTFFEGILSKILKSVQSGIYDGLVIRLEFEEENIKHQVYTSRGEHCFETSNIIFKCRQESQNSLS